MRLRPAPWAVAALLAAGYLAVEPPSADLAAHVYRTGLFEREGFTLWNNGWYAGHHVVGYSVLFPPLAGLLGPRLVGAVAAVAAAALFARLMPERWGRRGEWAALWFGVATATLLLSGRLPFALGVAVGLGAVVALRARRPAAAAALAAASALASPVAALFVAVAGAGHWVAHRGWGGVGVAVGALAPVVVLAVAFPEGGSEPFVVSAFLPVLAVAALALALVPKGEAALRAGALLYAAGATLAFVLSTPVGGNAARLGALVGGPLLLAAARPLRPAVLAVALVPLAFWQWSAAVRDVASAAGDPAVERSYYAPLLAALDARTSGPTRVEVLPTRHHWEAARVPPRYSLARGWQRQLDRRHGELFYEDELGATAYRRWLADTGTGWVAVPDAELDDAAEDEARLLRRPPPYLKPAWRGEHWRLYRVAPSPGLVRGPARLTRLGADSFALVAERPGPVVVRVRHSPYWELRAGRGCVDRAPGGWTRLRLARAGPATVGMRFAPGRVVDRGARCR